MLTERDLENPDPLRLDREIARASESLRKELRRRALGEIDAGDPFITTRLVAGRAAFQAVREMPASDPLREPLLGWVYRLADHRINAAASARVEVERRLTLHVISEPERARLSLTGMLERALGEPKRRDGFLDAFLASGEALSTSVATLWERRQEVAVRLGLASPDAITGVGADVGKAASDWLDRTSGALTEIAEPRLASLVSVALAEQAREGWPRHLLPRTILDLFRETDLFRSVDLDPGELPSLLAPASFLRAFARVGAAWVDATAPADQPFVVAHDPYGLCRRTLGALLGMLPASPAFARRSLGVDIARLADHRRALSAALIVESRVQALRVLLGTAALSGRRAFQETYEAETHRALGVALPATAAGALVRLHEDDAQRFAGLLLAARKAAALRDENDEDWYRNPRTTERLRDEARLSPQTRTTEAALEEGARVLEETLTRPL